MYISHQAYREMIKSPQMRAALQLQPICSVCHNQFMQMLYEAYPELHFSVTRKWVET
jgi:5-methylcytosine-specific restriction endonuclease McrA